MPIVAVPVPQLITQMGKAPAQRAPLIFGHDAFDLETCAFYQPPNCCGRVVNEVTRYVEPKPQLAEHLAFRAFDVGHPDANPTARAEPAMNVCERLPRLGQVLQHMTQGDQVKAVGGPARLLRWSNKDVGGRNTKGHDGCLGGALAGLDAVDVPSALLHQL